MKKYSLGTVEGIGRGGRKERKRARDVEECGRYTVVAGWLEGRTVASHPRVYRHEFRDEAGYGALEDGCVSAYHVFGHDLRFVVLSHD